MLSFGSSNPIKSYSDPLISWDTTSNINSINPANDSFIAILSVISSIKSKWGTTFFSISSHNTFYQIVEFICDNILPTIRSEDCGGNDIDEHCWDFLYGEELKTDKIKWETIQSGLSNKQSSKIKFFHQFIK